MVLKLIGLGALISATATYLMMFGAAVLKDGSDTLTADPADDAKPEADEHASLADPAEDWPDNVVALRLAQWPAGSSVTVMRGRQS